MQPPPWSLDGAESHANDRIAAFNQAVRRVAADHRAALVDCFDELLAGDHAALLHDGLHPNGAGHQLPTGSASGWPCGCDRQPVVGQAAAADHVLAVGLDLRQPDGRLRDPWLVLRSSWPPTR
jgi:GDSL-like Lipase/Acylhydrolase family